MARFPDLLDAEIARLTRERANAVRHKAEVVERCDTHIALMDERLDLAKRLSDAYARSYPKRTFGAAIAYEAPVVAEDHRSPPAQPEPHAPSVGSAIADGAPVAPSNDGSPRTQSEPTAPLTITPTEPTESSQPDDTAFYTPEPGFFAEKLTWSDIEATEIPVVVNSHRLRPRTKKAKIIRAVIAYLRLQKWAQRWELLDFLRKFNVVGSDAGEDAYLSVILSEAKDLFMPVRPEGGGPPGWILCEDFERKSWKKEANWLRTEQNR
jgi:hypothetical protein